MTNAITNHTPNNALQTQQNRSNSSQPRSETMFLRASFGMVTFSASLFGGLVGVLAGSAKGPLTSIGLGCTSALVLGGTVHLVGKAASYMIEKGMDLVDYTASKTWNGSIWVVKLPFRAAYQVGSLANQLLFGDSNTNPSHPIDANFAEETPPLNKSVAELETSNQPVAPSSVTKEAEKKDVGTQT